MVDCRQVFGELGAASAAEPVPSLARAAQPTLTMPKSPVQITAADATGNLALTRRAIESHRRAKPNAVSRSVFTEAPVPERPAEIEAQQDAGRSDIDLVPTGTDALSAGRDRDIRLDLEPCAADLPTADVCRPQALKMQAIAGGHGPVATDEPSGPRLEDMPDRVKAVPKAAAELLRPCSAWAPSPARGEGARVLKAR